MHFTELYGVEYVTMVPSGKSGDRVSRLLLPFFNEDRTTSMPSYISKFGIGLHLIKEILYSKTLETMGLDDS